MNYSWKRCVRIRIRRRGGRIKVVFAWYMAGLRAPRVPCPLPDLWISLLLAGRGRLHHGD